MKVININWQDQLLDDRLLISNIREIKDEKEKKKFECRKVIFSNYSQSDQNNITLSWTDTEKTKMKDFIGAMVTEYKTKWKDADFSNKK